tara:strand:- start:429 stop:1217 length:789 start_codon:yes stop_codon:yes gene_type:complete
MLPYDTIIISDIKKSGKTGIGAAIGLGWAWTMGGECFVLANSADHARDRAFSRISTYLDYLKRENPARYAAKVVDHLTDVIVFKDPYARIEALPCSAGSSAGSFVSLSIWDELWNYDLKSSHRLWAEFSPIPQLHGKSARVVVTYAGYMGESSLLWSIYEATVNPDQDGNPQGIKAPGFEDLPCYVSKDGKIFAYWNHEPNRPWHTEEFLESRKSDPSLPKHEYLRLWENRWTTGNESFIPIELIDGLMADGDQQGLYNHYP